MSSLRSKFKTNAGLEKDGVYYETGNTRIKLARAGGSNTAFNAATSKYAKDNQRAMATGSMEETKMLRFLMECYAEFVVTDWETEVVNVDLPGIKSWVKGIEGPSSELLEVTFENILATFVELPDLFAECKAVAEGIQYYRQSNLDGVIKN